MSCPVALLTFYEVCVDMSGLYLHGVISALSGLSQLMDLFLGR